jgi:hypothetical protein
MTSACFQKSPEEHLGHVKSVLKLLREHKLYAKAAKCHFNKQEVHFLGHVVGKDGLKVDPAKVETVRNWPEPRDVHQVRQFLGLTNYFRKFIDGYAATALPLQQLTIKRSVFSWQAVTVSLCLAGYERICWHRLSPSSLTAGLQR